MASAQWVKGWAPWGCPVSVRVVSGVVVEVLVHVCACSAVKLAAVK